MTPVPVTVTREAQLERDLEMLISKHADWLDGRTWQRLCYLLAEGYFDSDDLAATVDMDVALQTFTAVISGMGKR